MEKGVKKIAILGRGAWGGAISDITSSNGCETVLYSNNGENVKKINEKYAANRRVWATDNLKSAVENGNYIFVILPSSAVNEVLISLRGLSAVYDKKFVIFTKGIDEVSGKFFSELTEDFFPNSKIAALSGPNFAVEVAEKKLTVTTLATEDVRFFNELEPLLNCEYFRLKYFDDPIAAQLCGLVKNVLAILCGVSEGLELGRNTYSALITRGIGEIEAICLKLGRDSRVIGTPAGAGDIFLTCGSLKSRNMTFGFRIGGGERAEDVEKSMNTTVEGLSNAVNLKNIAERIGVNSIANAVLDIVKNNYQREKLIEIIMNNIFE
ncbi:MAG: NAD(P)H-dependent glycerol-3-phosphate dehydrogenase [Rickettsiales bacterium]|jgi:glycerol-3-phosphate dehydrogenase (NAD(P)+)|nr:NAD(P)H-dependent glycerol-3-phosphate dehydrogenase [Rickettsiales bacterium]